MQCIRVHTCVTPHPPLPPNTHTHTYLSYSRKIWLLSALLPYSTHMRPSAKIELNYHYACQHFWYTVHIQTPTHTSTPHIHTYTNTQAIWALGNIAGDSSEYRDIVLAAGIMDPLLLILTNERLELGTRRNASWTLSNLCRGKRSPPNADLVSRTPPISKINALYTHVHCICVLSIL